MFEIVTDNYGGHGETMVDALPSPMQESTGTDLQGAVPPTDLFVSLTAQYRRVRTEMHSSPNVLRNGSESPAAEQQAGRAKQLATTFLIRQSISAAENAMHRISAMLKRLELPVFTEQCHLKKMLWQEQTTAAASLAAAEDALRALSVPCATLLKSLQQHYTERLRLTATRLGTLLTQIPPVDAREEPIIAPLPEAATQPVAHPETELQMAKLLLPRRDVQRDAQLQNTIFALAERLSELKSAVYAQDTLIDRVDHCFSAAEHHVGAATGEIGKLIHRSVRIKDYTIYFLLYLICVLLCLSAIKTISASKAH